MLLFLAFEYWYYYDMSMNFDHITYSQIPRIHKGYDSMLTFSNCADTSSGFLHGLDGATITKQIIKELDGSVVDTETEVLTNNVENVFYQVGSTVTESIDTGIYKVIISYEKDGFKQLFASCRYIIEEA